MVKQTTSGKDPHPARRDRDGHIDTVSEETHMQVYARLAKIPLGEIHGHPGPRKARKQK